VVRFFKNNVSYVTMTSVRWSDSLRHIKIDKSDSS